MQRILMKHGTSIKLSQEMGVSDRTVREALRFATEGQQPDLIRQKAVRDYGGIPFDFKTGKVFNL